MADHFVDTVQEKLLPGYELRFERAGRGKGIFQLYKNDQVYREGGLKPVTVYDAPSHHERRKLLSKLEHIGAIEPQARPKSKEIEREPVVRSMPTKTDLQKAFEMAQEVMKDPKSSPKERSMARAYIKLVRRHVQVVSQLRRARTSTSSTVVSE